MTVKELKEKLESIEDDRTVMLALYDDVAGKSGSICFEASDITLMHSAEGNAEVLLSNF